MFYIRGRKTWTEFKPDLQYENWKNGAAVRVHHTADSGPAANTVKQEKVFMRRTEAFHVDIRGYAAIGYNYVIMPSGRVYEGRGWEKHGAHTLNNNDDIGICFAGNYSDKKPTRRAVLAYRLLRRKLRKKGAVIFGTYPHRATFATSCPGNGVIKALNL